MKTHPVVIIFKVSTLASLGIAVIAALVTQPTLASVADNSLVITENSPTSLTATYTLANGSTEAVIISLQNVPEEWRISVPSAGFKDFFNGINWVEPEPGLHNKLQSHSANVLDFQSDVSGMFGLSNGATETSLGTDTGNGLPISITVFDNAAAAEGHGVPDSGSTFGLLFLSFAALFGAVHFRLRQPCAHDNVLPALASLEW